MPEAQRQAVLDVLWRHQQEGLGLWAVLDLARDVRIFRALLDSRLEYRCLYSGKLARDLEMAAPQLVELLPGHRLTTRLLDEGWGQSWGIFIRIDDPANLRHHLRKFLRVRAAGRNLLFRFYDPRVLRAFLPTCTQEQLVQIFGPIDSLVLEGADARSVIEYRLGAQGLIARPTSLPAPAL